jgi:hypothetical protein
MEKEVSGTQGPEFVSRDKGFDLNEHKFFWVSGRAGLPVLTSWVRLKVRVHHSFKALTLALQFMK